MADSNGGETPFKVTRSGLQSALESSIQIILDHPLQISEIGCLSDALAVLAALERSGNSTTAKSLLSEYHQIQRFNGEFRTGRGEIEGTGCAIWSLVDHVRLTGDMDYLNSVYSSVRRGLRWIARNRCPDGSDLHSGLMPQHNHQLFSRYPAALWTLAGIQEAARAASVLGKSGHLFESESLFHELKHALLRSLDLTADETGKSGLPADPDSPPDELSARALIALIPGEVFSPDFKHLSGAIKRLFKKGETATDTGSFLNTISLVECAAVANHLLRRGDSRTWETIEFLLQADINNLVDASCLFWLIRNLLVFDHHSTLLIAPAYALRPPEDGEVVELIDAPTYYGPVSYRLERAGEELILEWRALQRHTPEYLIWPLPGVLLSSDPPTITLTGSRMGIHLDPGGGNLKIRLIAGTLQ